MPKPLWLTWQMILTMVIARRNQFSVPSGIFDNYFRTKKRIMQFSNKGTLIPIGGNEDKGLENSESDSLEFIDDGILFHVLKESGGVDSKIVIIPTASSIPIEVGENYQAAFSKLGCDNVSVLNIRDRDQAKTSSSMTMLEDADCVMFSGGDQSRIAEKIDGTRVHELLRNRYRDEEGFVIAGTSAGAMAMSKEMIAGSSSEAFVKGSVKMREGLGLIPQLIIDSHFIRRGRFGRLAEAVASFPDFIGVGLAEDTGLIIKRNSMEIIGSGMTIVFDPRDLTHNNQQILKEGTPMSLTNLKVHVLANGDRFNIEKKQVKVLPVEAAFS